jgi:hypothetical protein
MLEWTALLETKASPIPALLKLVLAPVLFSTVLLISTSDQCFGTRSPQILLTQKREFRTPHVALQALEAQVIGLAVSKARRSQNIGVLELRTQPPRSPDLLEQSVWAPIGLQIICLPAFRSRSGLSIRTWPARKHLAAMANQSTEIIIENGNKVIVIVAGLFSHTTRL